MIDLTTLSVAMKKSEPYLKEFECCFMTETHSFFFGRCHAGSARIVYRGHNSKHTGVIHMPENELLHFKEKLKRTCTLDGMALV